MTAREGPPENNAARTASPNCPGPSVKGLAKTHTRHPQGTTAPPRIGRYGSGWRDGFTAGAIDALRVAGRHLPVEQWHVVEMLADAYELAADD